MLVGFWVMATPHMQHSSVGRCTSALVTIAVMLLVDRLGVHGQT